MREGDEMSEKEFRNRLVEDLEEEGIFSLNLGQGTFDIYVFDWKKFIELKEMVDLSRAPKTTENIGIKFTKRQTAILKKLENEEYFPIVIVEDSGNYQIISSEKLKILINHPERRSKDKIIISKGYFVSNPLSYEEMWNKLCNMMS